MCKHVFICLVFYHVGIEIQCLGMCNVFWKTGHGDDQRPFMQTKDLVTIC